MSNLFKFIANLFSDRINKVLLRTRAETLNQCLSFFTDLTKKIFFFFPVLFICHLDLTLELCDLWDRYSPLH